MKNQLIIEWNENSGISLQKTIENEFPFKVVHVIPMKYEIVATEHVSYHKLVKVIIIME